MGGCRGAGRRHGGRGNGGIRACLWGGRLRRGNGWGKKKKRRRVTGKRRIIRQERHVTQSIEAPNSFLTCRLVPAPSPPHPHCHASCESHLLRREKVPDCKESRGGRDEGRK